MARNARRVARPRGAKRALHLQLARAIARLGEKPPLRDVSVHSVRKDLKRARAILRLMRGAIGEPAYRRANLRLRNAARPLSRVRDAKVSIGVVAKLRKQKNSASRRAELVTLERTLRRELQRAHHEVSGRPARLRRVRSLVQSVLSDSRSWRDSRDQSLHEIDRIYRKGRKAFARAVQNPSDATLHESRKQTKYLRHALEASAPATRRGIASCIKCAKSIGDALGEDHDLAVLRKKLAPRSSARNPRRELLSQIDHRREKLQRTAVKRSRHLYRRTAKVFVRAIRD